MEERYSVLEGLKIRLVSLNIFSSASDEMKVLEEAMDLVLGAETLPDEPPSKFQELQDSLIDVQSKLNQCECLKDRMSARLQKLETSTNYSNLLSNRKFGIVGGHQTDIEAVKKAIQGAAAGAKIKFRETSDKSVPPHNKFKEKYQDVDLLIVITGHAGHALTGHADMMEKVGLPILRFEKVPNDKAALLQDIRFILER